MEDRTNSKHYIHLLIMAVLSFGAMYILMYAMTDKLDDVYTNFNQFYMAGLMALPMVIIELIVMRAMYHNKKLNLLIMAISIAGAAGFYFLIRQQSGINDEQFLKSMIPHHSGAILMCEESEIKDPEIIELCRKIREGQQSEIDWMRKKLAEMKK